MKISQPNLIQELLEKMNMADANPCVIPLSPNQEFGEGELYSEVEKKKLGIRNILGSLNYLVMSTRPDLSLVVNHLARRISCFTEGDFGIMKKILRYLVGTKEAGLVYKAGGGFEPIGYADANFATDHDRKSVSGYVFMIGPCTVMWKTRKQATVAKSTTEAEYIALSGAVSEAIWLKNLLKELGFQFESITIKEDNIGCISLATKAIVKSKVKHIDITQHFIREKVDNGLVKIEYVPTADQLADGMTKALPRDTFYKHLNVLGVDIQLGGSIGKKSVRFQEDDHDENKLQVKRSNQGLVRAK
jgi:hypothetical protein